MEMASRFGCGKGDVPDIYTKPLAGHWFPGNAGDGSELNTAILFLHLENFATSPHRCVQTACRMDLFTKARELGIQTEFIDGQGHRHVTDAAALQIILDALPVRAPHRFLDRPVVVRSGQPGAERAQPGCTLPLRWKIVADVKVIAEGESRCDRTVIMAARICRSASYRLQLTDATVIHRGGAVDRRRRARAFGGDFDRCWLLAVQLYGVRSARNWGIGDFTDLERLIELAASWAPTASASIRCTRCSTTARAIAVPIRRTAGCFSIRSISMSKNCPGFQPAIDDSDALARLRAERHRRLCRRRRAEMAGAALGVRCLQGQSRKASASTTSRHSAPSAAPLLSRFACFEVLRHKFSKPWWEWPEQWRQPDEAKCAALASGRGCRRNRIRRIRAMDRRPAVAGAARSSRRRGSA